MPCIDGGSEKHMQTKNTSRQNDEQGRACHQYSGIPVNRNIRPAVCNSFLSDHCSLFYIGSFADPERISPDTNGFQYTELSALSEKSSFHIEGIRNYDWGYHGRYIDFRIYCHHDGICAFAQGLSVAQPIVLLLFLTTLFSGVWCLVYACVRYLNFKIPIWEF